MSRSWLAIGVLVCGAATSGRIASAAPSYTAAGIVQASNYSPAPFAPYSVLALFGSGLARSARALNAADIHDNFLPTELNFTQVFVDNSPAPLFYVSDTQINFLVPGKQLPGEMRIRVASQGLSGPEVFVMVVDAAPALFTQPNGFAIATHGDYSLITPESPARGGETVVIYATGLGKTLKNPATGEIPVYLSEIAGLATLKVSTGGTVVYAGLTPGSVGLYQINITLPANPGIDPELRVTVGSATSPAGLKLAVR
jgi:uncharacterized protein (TIGR03437 family)